MVKLKAVEVKMEEGEGLREKLVATRSDTKQEVLKVEEFVNGLVIIVPVVVDEKKREKDEVCRLI